MRFRGRSQELTRFPVNHRSDTNPFLGSRSEEGGKMTLVPSKQFTEWDQDGRKRIINNKKSLDEIFRPQV